MKPFSLLLALSSSFLGSHAATYSELVLEDQPVGYWRLGDPAGATNVANSGSSGSGQNGTPFQNVAFGAPGAIAGDADTAATFDGAQSKIDVPFSPELNSTTFTVEAWAKVLGGSGGYRSPVASRDDSPQQGYIFYADPNDNWQFWTGTGEQVGWNTVGGAFVEWDVWAHLVGTYDGTNKLFYVNGALVGGNQSRFGTNDSKVLRIGGSATESPVGDFFFVGEVDEVAVYSKVLSPDRVLAHYLMGSGGTQPQVPPGFALQPASLNRFRGETAVLSAIATGSLPLRYQWKKDDVDIAGATNVTLVLTNLQTGDAGNYTLEVVNDAGSWLSDPATLDVADLSRPEITEQPRSRTVLPGARASFSVAATGSTTFGYQWQFNNQIILNATNSSFTITNVQAGHLGEYKVIVTNLAGSTESAVAILQFPPPAETNYVNVVKQDAPVAYWRLDETSGETAEDEMGAHPGTYFNGVTFDRPGAIAGDTNPAAGFTAANLTKVDVPWSEALNAPTFTAEVWAKVTGTGVHRSPLTSRGDGPQRGYTFYAEPGNTWQFWVGASEPAGWITLQGPPVQMGLYAHLVGSYDGTNLLFYVNGNLVAQRQDVVFAPNDLFPLRIGGGATEGDGNFFFEGDVDEVAIYDKALSEDRILAHYVAGFPLTTPPTITSQPAGRFVLAGANVSFSVAASGGVPLLYQWKLNNVDILNATNSTLDLTNITAAQTGDYTVVVSNAGGSVTSEVARLVIPAAPVEPYVDVVKADGPVAYWRLGETEGEIIDDEIGFNDGFLLNGVTLGVPGAILTDTNTAASFSAASTQKIDIPWSDVLNPPIFTIEAWARVTGGSSHRSPVTSRADVPQRGYIFYADPGNTWQFWTGRGDSSGWDNLPGPAVQNNEWAHLVGTYDGTTKRFYVNGTEVGSRIVVFGPNDASPLRIGAGASEGDGNYFFEGDVDEVAIYDKALGAERIIMHYLAGRKQDGGQNATLAIARDDAGVRLTWPEGTLQSTDALGTPWQNVAGATSPYIIPNLIGTARFYRLLVE